jgi:hypothetical protein
VTEQAGEIVPGCGDAGALQALAERECDAVRP